MGVLMGMAASAFSSVGGVASGLLSSTGGMLGGAISSAGQGIGSLIGTGVSGVSSLLNMGGSASGSGAAAGAGGGLNSASMALNGASSLIGGGGGGAGDAAGGAAAGGGGILSKLMTGASTLLPVAGSGLNLLSSIQKANQAKAWAKFQKRQSQADAIAQLGVAKVQAKKIREQTKKSAADKAAELSGSGVVVGSGVGDEAVRDILEGGFYDANITMYNANDVFMRALQDIEYNSIKAKQENKGNKLGTVTSLIGLASSGLTAATQWKKDFGGADTSNTTNNNLSIA